jgi:hypothetical protein
LLLFFFRDRAGGMRTDEAKDMREAAIEQQLRDVDKQWLHASTVQDTAFSQTVFAEGIDNCF